MPSVSNDKKILSEKIDCPESSFVRSDVHCITSKVVKNNKSDSDYPDNRWGLVLCFFFFLLYLIEADLIFFDSNNRTANQNRYHPKESEPVPTSETFNFMC